MATVVRMPAALAGATEGAIQSWLAEVGQSVSVGDPIAEIETEKATVEYAAESAGTIGRLLAEPGQNIPVGAPIAVILAAGEGDDAIGPALAAAGADEPAGGAPVPDEIPAPDEMFVASAPEPETADGAQPDAPAGPVNPVADPPQDASNSDAQSTGHRAFLSPIVRRLVRERGLSLDGVRGTGPGGRIVRRDLDGLAEPGRAAEPTQATSPATPSVATAYTDVPLTGMRRAIARRLTESKSTVPHFYVTAHCRVDELLKLRRQANEVADRKLSVNDFVLKAVALALVKVPEANAIYTGESIRRFAAVDLAVAVAVEGGLLTPVIRGAHALSVSAIAETVADLAERSRAGRLQQDELEGGSFAVSNLGMYGVDEFAAILNPPQSGILAVGAAKERAVVDDGRLAVGTLMTVTLSADHRVVDGAVAAQWMTQFTHLIEHPVGLLL